MSGNGGGPTQSASSPAPQMSRFDAAKAAMINQQSDHPATSPAMLALNAKYGLTPQSAGQPAGMTQAAPTQQQIAPPTQQTQPSHDNSSLLAILNSIRSGNPSNAAYQGSGEMKQMANQGPVNQDWSQASQGFQNFENKIGADASLMPDHVGYGADNTDPKLAHTSFGTAYNPLISPGQQMLDQMRVTRYQLDNGSSPEALKAQMNSAIFHAYKPSQMDQYEADKAAGTLPASIQALVGRGAALR